MASATPVKYIALAGPTASGKTAAALEIAARYPVEIISVDSALVYRGMDIGTAKPTATELAAVPHHLIDIRDPLQAYSAAAFVLDAKRLIGEITARGKLPLTVLQQFNPKIEKDVYDVLSLRGSLNARNTLGGTAPVQVRAQIVRHRARLSVN